MRKIIVVILALLTIIQTTSAAYPVMKLGVDLMHLKNMRRLLKYYNVKATPSVSPEPYKELTPSKSRSINLMMWILVPSCVMFVLCWVANIIEENN